jgi:hypothetical protein
MSTLARVSLGHGRRARTGGVLGPVAGIAAFALSPSLFEPSADFPPVTGLQLPLFVTLTALEAVAFGAGIALLVAGRGVVAQLFSSPARAAAVHAALTWALVSWWPHDGLHAVNGSNVSGLLGIEYGFHVSLMAAAAVLAWALTREARA